MPPVAAAVGVAAFVACVVSAGRCGSCVVVAPGTAVDAVVASGGAAPCCCWQCSSPSNWPRALQLWSLSPVLEGLQIKGNAPLYYLS